MSVLRLLFWNVSNLFEPGAVTRGPQTVAELDARIERLATIVAAEKPAIIGLAEVQNERLFRMVAERVLPEGYGALWEPGPPSGTTVGTGLGVLYDPKVVNDVRREDAFRPTAWARPRVLITSVELGNGQACLLVLNHWKSRMAHPGTDPESDRAESAEWLGEFLAGYSEHDCAVIVGDFNAEPWEPPFGEFKLRASRSFSGALWSQATPAYLYNTAWRFCSEPEYWESIVAQRGDYREVRPKGSHDSSPPAMFDQLLVSGGALKAGPVTLLERSVRFVVQDARTSRHKRNGVLVPLRWSWDPATSVGTGASDHFQLVADFTY